MPAFTTGCSSFDRQNDGVNPLGGNSRVQASVTMPPQRHPPLSDPRMRSTIRNIIGLGNIPAPVWDACLDLREGEPLVLHEFGNARSGEHLRWRIHGWILATPEGTPIVSFAGMTGASKQIIDGIIRHAFANACVPQGEIAIHSSEHGERAWRWAEPHRIREEAKAARKAARAQKDWNIRAKAEAKKALASAILDDELEAILEDDDQAIA